MPVPGPRLLNLDEAATRLANRCAIETDEAERALARAFREACLSLYSNFNRVELHEKDEIDFRNSTVSNSFVGYLIPVQVYKQHIDEWLAQAESGGSMPKDLALAVKTRNSVSPVVEGNGVIAYATLRATIERHGKATERTLTAHAREVFPGKQMSRSLIRQVIDELWGRPGRTGRPPKRPAKSPE